MFRKSLTDFLHKSHQEVDDYKEVGQILKKYAETQKITKEEIKLVRQQLIDTLKMGGLSAIFIFPFGTILIVALLKFGDRLGLDFKPSAWKN